MSAKLGEIVNGDHPGELAVMGEPIRWWSHPRFRLVPLFRVRPGDRWNNPEFNFDWLGFAAWSLSSPDLGASVELDDLGLEFRVLVPYVILRWKLPLFPSSWHQALWRKSPDWSAMLATRDTTKED